MKRLGARCAIILAGAAAASAATAATQVNVTNDRIYRWGEPEIVINPKNPNNLILAVQRGTYSYACKAANSQPCQMVTAKSNRQQPYGLINNLPDFMNVVTFASFDRGKTWKGVTMRRPGGHPDLVEAGHPTATSGRNGAFYVGWNAIHFFDGPTLPVSHGGIAVSRSTDGGRTWNAPVLSGTPLDHPFMTSDPVTGRIFSSSGTPGQLGPLSKGDPKAQPSEVRDRWVVSSMDGLRWTAPQPFGGYAGSGAPPNFIPFIAAAHGQLAAAFRSTTPQTCGTPAPADCTVFQTSTDAGAHWTRHVMSVGKGYSWGPLMAADPSRPGHFAIGFLMNKDTEFHVYQTNDSGKSWKGPVVITDDAGKVHYHAWMAYSPKGVLGISWRTKDQAPAAAPSNAGPQGAAVSYNVWAAISRDGGTTFTRPLKVTATPSPAPDSGPFGTSGDALSSIALGLNEAYVAWGDWRTGEENVFFSAINFAEFGK